LRTFQPIRVQQMEKVIIATFAHPSTRGSEKLTSCQDFTLKATCL
jgi:hypothetical protein